MKTAHGGIELGALHHLIVHTNDRDEPELDLEYRVMAPRKAQTMQISGH